MKVAVLSLVALGMWLGSLSFAREGLRPELMTFSEAWAACLRQGLTLPELSQLKDLELKLGSQFSRIESEEGGFLWTLSKNANPDFPRKGFSLGKRHAIMARLSDRGFALCVPQAPAKEFNESFNRTPAGDLIGTLRQQVE